MTFADIKLAPCLAEQIEKQPELYKGRLPEQLLKAACQGKDLSVQQLSDQDELISIALLSACQRVTDLKQKQRHAGPRCVILSYSDQRCLTLADMIQPGCDNSELTYQILQSDTSESLTATDLNADFLFCTPGTLAAMKQLRPGGLKSVGLLLLDQTQTTDPGFSLSQINEAIKKTPRKRQNIIFFQRKNSDIGKLCSKILRNPVYLPDKHEIRHTFKKQQHNAHIIPEPLKSHLLIHMINNSNWKQLLIFTRSSHQASRLASKLNRHKINAGILDKNAHGGKALKLFKQGKITALITTDAAAHTLGSQCKPSQTIFLDLPVNAKDYISRAESLKNLPQKLTVIALVSPEDTTQLQRIEQQLKLKIPRVDIEGFTPPIDACQGRQFITDSHAFYHTGMTAPKPVEYDHGSHSPKKAAQHRFSTEAARHQALPQPPLYQTESQYSSQKRFDYRHKKIH